MLLPTDYNETSENKNITITSCLFVHILRKYMWYRQEASCDSYIHGRVDLCNRLVISWELVDLHSVANQLTGDFDFELGQFALGDGIWLGNDWDNIDLQLKN